MHLSALESSNYFEGVKAFLITVNVQQKQLNTSTDFYCEEFSF